MTRNTDPGFLAIDQPPVNIGIMENRGFEVVVGYNGNAGELQYNVSVNVSKAQNQVIFTDEISPLEPYQSRTGQPFQTNFGYRYLGFYTQQEVDVINAQRDQGTVSDRTYPIPDFATTLAAGDLKYADLNGDGIINLADQEVFGDPSTPQVNGGLSGGISYKGFDISFGFQFATEVSRNLNGVFRSPFYFSNDLALLQTHYDDAWTPETAETARWPRRTFQNAGYNQVNSSFWVRDASYLRLRNAEIGYSFNRNVLDKIGLSGLRVYMRGNNLFTLQKEELEWVDPEQELRQSFGYPLVRIARLGLNVTF
jgi:hypothetical protein